MRKNMKWLAVILMACLLFSATGTLAAQKTAAKDEVQYDIALKQASRKVAFYEERSTKSARMGYIAKGMAIPAYNMKDGFWQVTVGPFKGYVQSKYLIDPDENVTVTSFATVKAKTRLVALPNRSPNTPATYQLTKGQPVYVLTSLKDIVFIKAGDGIGLLYAKYLIPCDETSPVIEWVEMLKKTDIRNGDSKNAARLARANKGNWVAVLGKTDDEMAIVRHGEIIGVMSLKNTKPVDPS